MSATKEEALREAQVLADRYGCPYAVVPNRRGTGWFAMTVQSAMFSMLPLNPADVRRPGGSDAGDG